MQSLMQTEIKMSRIPERKLNLLKTSELVLTGGNNISLFFEIIIQTLDQIN